MSTKIGRAGEFFAAYILETFGVEVHHVSREGADLWCKVRGSLTTVQVKAASQPRNRKAGWKSSYAFHTISYGSGANWYCFIALDKQILLMRPAAEILTKTVSIDPSEFNEANQRRTIDAFMETC